MVRYLFFALRTVMLAGIFLWFGGSHSWAQSFSAHVDRMSVYVGESFVLELLLKDANSNGTPDISPLRKDFEVKGLGQSSSINMSNGSVTATVSWRYSLLPKRAGHLVIPEISIQAGSGVLRSEEVTIEVSDDPNPLANKGDRDLFIHTEFNKLSVSVNEPVVYTVKLVMGRPASRLSLSELKIDDALVEKYGEPKIYDTVVEGRALKIAEIRYLITPLKSGNLVVPSISFQGMVADGSGAGSIFGSPFGGRGGSDPFGVLQDLGVFADFMGQPFTLVSEKATIKVAAASSQLDTWIPAKNVKISDVLEDGEGFKAGEPITRRITVVVQGNTGAVLPSLEAQVQSARDFSVYAEKPETGMSVSDDGRSVSGWREETYTLVPRYGGEFVLPEIRIPWWDTAHEKISYAVVPEKKVRVAGPPPTPEQVKELGDRTTSEPQDAISEDDRHEGYSFLEKFLNVQGGLALTAVCVAGAFAFALFLMRKRGFLNARSEQAAGRESVKEGVEVTKEDNVSCADIKRADSVEALHSMLLKVVQDKFSQRRILSLRDIQSAAGESLSPEDKERVLAVLSKLERALYSGEKQNFEFLREEVAAIADIIVKRQEKKSKPTFREDRLGALNPS